MQINLENVWQTYWKERRHGITKSTRLGNEGRLKSFNDMNWDTLTFFLKPLHCLFASPHTFMIGNYGKFIWKQLYIDELKIVDIPCLHLRYQHIKVYSQVKHVRYCIMEKQY